jgi:hypothetical protein
MSLCEKRWKRAERAASRGDVPTCEKWIALARKVGTLPGPASILLMYANRMAMRCGVIRLAA